MNRVYISGPMTGLPEFNFPAFNEAARFLRGVGHTVINPAENFGGDTTLSWTDYIRKDIADILTVEGVAVLPGWEESRGARLEVSIARALGLPVFEAMGANEIPDPELVLAL